MRYGKNYMMFHLIVDYLHVLNYLFSLFIALFKFILLIDCVWLFDMLLRLLFKIKWIM